MHILDVCERLPSSYSNDKHSILGAQRNVVRFQPFVRLNFGVRRIPDTYSIVSVILETSQVVSDWELIVELLAPRCYWAIRADPKRRHLLWAYRT